ncbi:unnamed protein product [Brachionus calyciflorus]|uniref:Uncharacterized protein n=1 Tax=Brachionus calyciflorus TaxID=104777 RepID=A0A814R3N5_9BILA|nr:unnamed protein product [Brachionus calyciflorus]
MDGNYSSLPVVFLVNVNLKVMFCFGIDMFGIKLLKPNFLDDVSTRDSYSTSSPNLDTKSDNLTEFRDMEKCDYNGYRFNSRADSIVKISFENSNSKTGLREHEIMKGHLEHKSPIKNLSGEAMYKVERSSDWLDDVPNAHKPVLSDFLRPKSILKNDDGKPTTQNNSETSAPKNETFGSKRRLIQQSLIPIQSLVFRP